MDLITLALAKKFSSDAVDAWLSEHVDPETGYVLDDTLTLDNAAAPAGTVGEKLNELEGTVEDLLDTKANIDGYYESMTVGNAEQLVATVGVEDSVPFNFRTTGGSADVGDRKTMEVVGGTLTFNQLVSEYHPSETNYGLTIVNNGTSVDISGKVTTAPSYNTLSVTAQNIAFIRDGRKYLVMANKPTPAPLRVGGYASFIAAGGIAGIWSNANGGTWPNGIAFEVYVDDEINVTDFRISVIDLTQMFGSTIADYIYSLEQANAGAGVAWFKKLFPKPYYAYNAGELMSVKTSAYKSVGFNALDIDNNLAQTTTANVMAANRIPVVSGQKYELCWDSGLSFSGIYVYEYDASGTMTKENAVYNTSYTSLQATLRDDTVTVQLNFYKTGGILLADVVSHHPCLHLVWDGERDGEYEPYETHTYPLDSDLELRGIPKLDADNQLYYDGDIYEADGTVGRRFGIVDLGTLTWSRQELSGTYRFLISGYGTLPNSITTGGVSFNAICTKYPMDRAPVAENDVDKVCCLYNGIVLIRDDAYSTAEAFKAAMSGVYLVYELATPEEETADPFQTPQIVNDFGTEEFVDTRTIPVPVGHNSKYQANLRAKLEMAPNSPSGDGDYIVRQTSGQNTYVPITFPADELPAAPTTDGNYVLKCTVSSGTATFTWEAQT